MYIIDKHLHPKLSGYRNNIKPKMQWNERHIQKQYTIELGNPLIRPILIDLIKQTDLAIESIVLRDVISLGQEVH